MRRGAASEKTPVRSRSRQFVGEKDEDDDDDVEEEVFEGGGGGDEEEAAAEEGGENLEATPATRVASRGQKEARVTVLFCGGREDLEVGGGVCEGNLWQDGLRHVGGRAGRVGS